MPSAETIQRAYVEQTTWLNERPLNDIRRFQLRRAERAIRALRPHIVGKVMRESEKVAA